MGVRGSVAPVGGWGSVGLGAGGGGLLWFWAIQPKVPTPPQEGGVWVGGWVGPQPRYLPLFRFLFWKRAVFGGIKFEPTPTVLETGQIPLDLIPILLKLMSSTIYNMTFNFF